MLEERRRLRRNQVLLEGALAELQEDLTRSLREKHRQEASSGWCGPELARRVDELRADWAQLRRAVLQVRRAIEVASEEVDRLLQNRWLEGGRAAPTADLRQSGRPLPRLTPGLRRRHG